MSQLLTYVVRNYQDLMFMVHYWLEVCACVCHEELVWLSAMQLEAIIEPITFCLLLSFALPLSSLLSLSFSSSLSSAPIFCLSDFNSAGLSLCEPRPNFTVNPWILPSLTSSLHRLIQLCTVSHAAATLARLPPIQSFFELFHSHHHPF